MPHDVGHRRLLGAERRDEHVATGEELLLVGERLLVEAPGKDAVPDRHGKAPPDARVPQDAVRGGTDLRRVDELSRPHAIGERDELGLHPDEELLASPIVACLSLG